MTALLLSLLIQQPVGGFAPEKKPVSPDGVRAVCDVPTSQHIRNTGGSDGAGLCVFTSIELAADWQQLPALAGFQRWMTRRPGGGYPEKVDAMLKAYCKEKGVPVPPYVQHTDGDEAVLDAAIAAGLMPCITYGGRDDFYRSGIYHMVDLVHLDKDRGCIVDNNRPGTFLWMTRKELLDRWRSMQGGWVFCWLAPPPPPYNAPPRAVFEEPANFGVNQEKVHKAEEPKGPEKNNYGIILNKPAARYSLTGVEVTRDAALDAIKAIGDRINVTLVGDYGYSLDLSKPVADKLHVQFYKASDWEVGQFGLEPGLTIRSVAVGRLGKDISHLSAADAANPDKVLKAITEALNPPAPLPQPDEPDVPVDPPLPAPKVCPVSRLVCTLIGAAAGVLVAALYRVLPRKAN